MRETPEEGVTALSFLSQRDHGIDPGGPQGGRAARDRGNHENATLAPGPDRTQLDLAPETPNPPFDEYGVSFVGHNGGTPIFPGPNCSLGAPEGDRLVDANGVPTFADISRK